MATDLKLQVHLGLVDKALGPLKRIHQGTGKLSEALKVSRDQLNKLRKIDNFQKQQSALGGTAEKLNQAQARVRELREQMRTLGSEASSKLKNDFTKANQTVGDLTRKVQAQRTELGQHRQRLKDAGIGTAELRTSQANLKTQMAQASTAIDQQKTKLKQLHEQQQRLQRLKDTGAKIHGAGMSVAAHGAGAAYGGANLARRAGAMLGVGMEFDATMSRVQALARLDKGSEQMAALRAQAKKLGAETMFSATDAAQGQAFLAMAGFSPESIMAAMPGLLDMALAGDMDLGRTADIASNILGGFKLDASQMGNVSDILTKAFTTSNVSLEMLGDTMKYVGPVAAAAGMSLEESAAMAGLLGNVGIQSSQAGTTLRSMMLRLSAPTGKAGKALDELGVKARDSQGNVRNMIEVLGDVATATKGMGSGEQLEYLKRIFGEEPAAGMAELLSKAGDEGIEKYLDIIRDHQGAAGTTAAAIADNLKGDLDELSSAWEGLQVEFFDQNSGALRELAQQVTQVLDRINVWIQDNPELVASIAKWAAITLAVVTVLGALAATIGTGMMMLGGLIKLFVALGPLVGLLKGLATGFMLLGKALLLNPIGLAITLIATAGYLLWRNWDGVVGGLKALWADLANAAGRAWQWIKDTTVATGQAIANFFLNWTLAGLIYKHWDGIMAWMGQLPDRFMAIGGQIMQGLVSGIKNAGGALKGAVVGAGESAIGWFKDKLGIHSPSRVFAELGGFTMAGLSQGLAGGEGDVLGQIASTAKRLAAAGAVTLGLGAGSALAGDSSIAFDNRPPLAQGAGPATSIGGATYNITINAAPGQDANAIARAVAQELDKRERAKGARQRSALYDQE